MADVVIGITLIDELNVGIGLLEPDLIGTGVNGVAPGVQGGERESLRKLMGQLNHHRVETGVDIGKWDENPAEATISNSNRRRTSWVGRTASDSVCAEVLDSVHGGVPPNVPRAEPVHIDSPYELAASASLVANVDLPVPKGFELRL